MSKGGLERFVVNRAGLKAILKSPGVAADLKPRADRVAAVLRSELAGEDDWEIVSDVRVGRNRAGALVSGVPMRIELKRRIMGSAIDSAR
jgi:hypothetical protein